MVFKVIRNLKANTVSGPDETDNGLLKILAGLVPSLTKLFNKILVEGKIPDQWGASEIILLYKKGIKLILATTAR